MISISEISINATTSPKQKPKTCVVQTGESALEMKWLLKQRLKSIHAMGYIPITPSTEIAEYLNEMKANGEHDIVMIPADGEHGSAGIFNGASTAGWTCLNATNLFALRVTEHQDVRLPVIVASDGFFTSHQKRSVQYFTDRKVVSKFVQYDLC